MGRYSEMLLRFLHALLAARGGHVFVFATRLSNVTRDKTMLQVLNDPAQHTRIIYTTWSPFSQVDVVETNDPSSRYVFSDGGAGSYMLRYDGTLDSLPETARISAQPREAAVRSVTGLIEALPEAVG